MRMVFKLDRVRGKRWRQTIAQARRILARTSGPTLAIPPKFDTSLRT